RLGRAVLAAQVPDLPGLLEADGGDEQPRAVPAVERADLGPGLPEHRVVRGDRQVAAHVQHVAAADRVPGDHGDHRLGGAPALHLEVEHVAPPDTACVEVPVVAADLLVAAGAERLGPGPGQDDHADARVVAGDVERVRKLEQRGGTERVTHLGPVDGDLRDAV